VPFGPKRPGAHAEFTERYTGRTGPTAAGIGTPALFFTDDDGCYLTNTRDVRPDRMREYESMDDVERILGVVRRNTKRYKTGRLDLPAQPPHTLPPNLWMANAPGSTLFMPIGDASEEFLGVAALVLSNGAVVIDGETGEPAGNLAPFIRSGMLDESKQVPLGEIQQDAYEFTVLELAFMGHNIALTMQAMGLGGLYYSGLDRWSVLGAFAGQGIEGLGFRFAEDERWPVPNPVGIDGLYEGLCPPYYPDMHAAVEAFVQRKFGPGGAYDPETPGPWRDSAAIKAGVTRYSEDFVECLAEVAQYVYDKHGRFPGTRTTMVLPGYVQAQHIDTDFYDTYYKPGAYLPTHSQHLQRWHAGD
jgi:hypothetical protein